MALTDMTALARSRDLLKEANGLCCELGRRRQELRVWWISHRDELVPEHREIVQAQLETAGVKR